MSSKQGSSAKEGRVLPYIAKLASKIPSRKYEVPQDIETQRKLIFAQDREILELARMLAKKVSSFATRDRTPRILIVGGFVRDALIGLQPKDADLEAYGLEPAELEQVVHDTFPGQVKQVGKAYGILKIELESGVKLDISVPRRLLSADDSDFYSGDSGITIEERARLSDFTINSLATDPLSAELIDTCGGLGDLRDRVLRITDFSKFATSPIRVYRAAQFTARLGLAVDSASASHLSELVSSGALEEIADKRVAEEFRKLLLKAEFPSLGLEVLRQIGIIDRYFPQIYFPPANLSSFLPNYQENLWLDNVLNVDRAALFTRTIEGLESSEKLSIMLASLAFQLSSILKFLKTKHPDKIFCEKMLRDFFSQFCFSEYSIAAAAICLLKCNCVAEVAEIEKGKAAVSQGAPLSGFGASGVRGPGRRAGPGMIPGKPRPAAATQTNHLNEQISRLLGQLYPASPRSLLAVYELSMWEGDSQNNSSLKLSSAGRRFVELLKQRKIDGSARVSLLSKDDLVNKLNLPRGMHLGQIIGEVERRRLELLTHENALSFVQQNRAKFLT